MDLRAALNAIDEDYEPESIQYETVDVYLLRPEEPRDVELKDFTIMKPKNNKMHRLVRYYPGCEISYQAATRPQQPEEKTVASPGGTITTTFVVPDRTPRHNGGFSNPSRHAEIFRLKRRLLKEYFASVQDDDREAAMFDALIGRSAHPVQQPTNVVYSEQLEAPILPAMQSTARRSLPKYKPVVVGDEDTIELTSERTKRMSLDERVQYVSSLWPGLAPIDGDNDIMNYYGIEVHIISEEEREEELAAAKSGSEAFQNKTEEENAFAAARVDEHQVNVSELPAVWYCKMNRWDKNHNVSGL
ncbi:hypothetical protein BBO99_00001116 [Phytophthora kernoviae]|uniref:Uncharacterized protein n=2 Tax=Phytophthora kernoviae TaxID=325452 RepID=A0A3R7MQ70_9STRA|nr:hypothetical protein G195_005079 [Phytophthora kernoviae 00238/432]KAG2529667.1 hypothetical protein JM18_001347 [Phytophthora kernoviae]KAG2531126.1 hypothetical protein JM16_001211 [Phytophthora kernoviae]RLN21203.1 hypothetical protein BBI17_004195 [Phytophthora kernoviae]RLN84672.1 hypothetical protein BBO99_00001116 [Phytophthora kernoviae]